MTNFALEVSFALEEFHRVIFLFLALDESTIPDDLIRVISHCRLGDTWNQVIIINPYGHINKVSSGVNIMVQTTSLPILEAATEGRVTPLRL